MSDQFANGAQTNLAAPMLAGDLTLTVTSALGFPPSTPFTIVVDFELMKVTAVSGTTWTVTRAVEPFAGVQTAVGHASAALVTCVFTVQDLLDVIAAGVAQCLAVVNNLSDLANVVTARANLGLGSAALQPSSAFDAAGLAATVQMNLTTEISRAEAAEALALLKASNLSDLGNVVTARTNLGLGSAALQAASAFDVSGAAAGVQTNLTAEISRAETAEGLLLVKASNLSDLASVPAARTNLGLGSAATQSSASFDAAGSAATAQANAEAFATSQGYITTIGAGSITNAMLAGAITASKLVGTDIATVGTLTGGTWNATTIAIAHGGTGATTAAGALTNLGATTVGASFLELVNPSAITFIRVNADNSVSALSAAAFLTAIGGGSSALTIGTTGITGGAANDVLVVDATGLVLQQIGASSAGGVSNVVLRNASGNAHANNFESLWVNNAVPGTITLGMPSARGQVFTGSGAYTLVLPDATTLEQGHTFDLRTVGSGAVVTIQYFDTTTFLVVPGNSQLSLEVVNNSFPSIGGWGAAALVNISFSVNTFLAGPASGGSGYPAPRALVSADIPNNAANTAGNAATATLAAAATVLATARAINGVNFDGSAPITITAAAGTLTGTTLAANVLASSLTSVGVLAALTVTATITGSVSGNAGTATKLATARTIAITGDIAYTSPAFDGSGNVTAAGTIAALAVTTAKIAANAVTSAKVDSSVIIAAGTNAFTGAQSMGSFNLTNVLDPTAPQHAATKNYVDLATASLAAKNDCQAATTAALAAATYNNGSSGVGATLTLNVAAVLLLDGYTVLLNDRLLIKNQASAVQNGIYSVTTLGTVVANTVLTRTLDFDQAGDGVNGALVYVLKGTTNGNTLWSCTTGASVTFGTTNINWSKFLGATYSADGATLTLTGTTFSINLSNANTWTGPQTIPTVESAEFDNGNSGTAKTIVWDNGNLQKVTITGVCTFTFTAPTAPGRFSLRIIQDGTGHAITLPTMYYFDANNPSITANSVSVLTVLYVGGNYYAVVGANATAR